MHLSVEAYVGYNIVYADIRVRKELVYTDTHVRKELVYTDIYVRKELGMNECGYV